MLPLSSAFLCLPWCICSCSTLVAGEPNPMRPRADLRALPQALGCVETPSRHSGCCGDSTWVSRSTDGQCFSPLGHKAAFQAPKREAGPRVCPSFLLIHQGPRSFWESVFTFSLSCLCLHVFAFPWYRSLLGEGYQ